MTKTSVISGFLGAGKTTLIKKLVKEVFNGEQVVIIENEFGEIGIDSGFLKESGIMITEMNSGCICCSLVGDFSKSLKDVIDKYNPDRIIIEPSGVGKLSDVLKAVNDVAKDADIEVTSSVAVVDAKKAKMYSKNFGEFFADQIATASTVVLSRTQLVNEKQLDTAVDIIKNLNKKANIITTPWDEIDGHVILNAIEKTVDINAELLEETIAEHHELHHRENHHHEHHHEHQHGEECTCGHHHDHEEHHHHEHGEECTCGHHHDHDHEHHHADDVFTSWGIETHKKYSADEIKDILNRLSDNDEYGVVLRAKGIVASDDGKWIHFDFVPEEFEVRFGEADYTGRICVIGTKLNTDVLEKTFK